MTSDSSKKVIATASVMIILTPVIAIPVYGHIYSSYRSRVIVVVSSSEYMFFFPPSLSSFNAHVQRERLRVRGVRREIGSHPHAEDRAVVTEPGGGVQQTSLLRRGGQQKDHHHQ